MVVGGGAKGLFITLLLVSNLQSLPCFSAQVTPVVTNSSPLSVQVHYLYNLSFVGGALAPSGEGGSYVDAPPLAPGRATNISRSKVLVTTEISQVRVVI